MSGQVTGNVRAQTGSGGLLCSTSGVPARAARSCLRIPVRAEGPLEALPVQVRRGKIGRLLAAAPRLIARKFRVLTAGWRRAGPTLTGPLVVMAMMAVLGFLLLILS